MKKLTPFLLLFGFLTAQSQNCDPTFYYFDDADPYSEVALEQLPDGSFLMAGTSSVGSKDVCVLRIDPLGNEVWRKTFGAANDDIGKALVPLADGNFMVLADTKVGNYQKIYLIKIDVDGNLIWENSYNDPNKNFISHDMVEDGQGNIIVAGHQEGVSDDIQMVMLKVASTGTQLDKSVFNPFIAQWDETWIQPGFGKSQALSVTVSNDGNYLFSGTSQPDFNIFPLSSNLILMKTTPNLDIIWQKDFFGRHAVCYSGNLGVGIVQMPDDNIYVADLKTGYCLDGPSEPIILYKFDNQGNKIWDKSVGEGGTADIFPTTDGSFIITGSLSQLVKADTSGAVIWQTNFGYTAWLNSYDCIEQLPDGGYAFGAYGYNNAPSFVLVKTDSLGNNCKNQLSGLVYYDQNGNCKYDNLETVLPNSFVKMQPGSQPQPQYDLTGIDGRYRFTVDTGIFELSTIPYSTFWQANCPPGGILSLDLSAPYQNPDSLHLGLVPQEICPVLAYQSSLTSARICTRGQYSFKLCNEGSQTANSVFLTLDWPDELKFLDANLPFTLLGSTFTFDFGPLGIGECKTLYINDSIRCDAMLGTQVCIPATIGLAENCSSYSYSKNDTVCRILTNSYDPNDKQGFADNQENCFNAKDSRQETIYYTVRFQNTGNDTAYRVMVIDTLDTGIFDIETFKSGPSSHTYELMVRSDNMLIWIFRGINLTDTFTNYSNSQGYLSFSVKTRLPLVPSAEIQNQADIYFDMNDPISTPENKIAACAVVGMKNPANDFNDELVIFPNPATDVVALRWSDMKGQAICRIIDLSGAILIEKMLSTLEQGEIQLSGLSPGLYIISIESDGRLMRGKVVVH